MPAVQGSPIYIIDPEYNGETGDAWKDTALCSLIFNATPVTGEAWQKVEGGHEGQQPAGMARGQGVGLAAGGWGPLR